MKFDHSFKLYKKSKTGRTYICDNTVAKLDFISPAAIRVAIYKKGAYMLPTFTINPNNDLSQSGRDKLATDDFEMFEPVAKKTDNGEKFILKNGIEVNLDLHNFLLSYEKNGKRIFADRAPLAYNIDGEFGTGAYHYISREDDEKIFGLGDKAGKTDKRGKTYRIETADSMGFDAAKEILAERKRLIPYLYNCAYEAVENELPIQAPPFIYFDDENIDVNTTSFMLGRKILAKCVLDKGKDSVNIYLPKGEIWYLNGKKFTGGQNVELKIPADKEVPYFVKGGCVLPSDEGEYGFKKSEKLVFTVYPNESGEFKDTFFTYDGISYEYQKGNCAKLEFNVKANESEIELEVNNSGNMNIDYELRLVETDKRKLVIK